MANLDRNNIKNALTQNLCEMLDDLGTIDYDENQSLYTRRQNVAKKEFARCRIENMDFYGFMDLYYSN